MIFNKLSIVAGFFYIVLGIAVMVYKFLETNVAYSLGGLMILYGVFRIVRSIYRIREQQDEE